MNPTTLLAVLLGLSVLGNVATTTAYLGKRDEAVSLAQQRDNANASALACSKSVDRYRESAENRAQEAEKRAAAATALAKALEARGDAELTRAPAVPGDPCKSAQVETDEWVKKRRAP